jgi:hypothetical protein
MTTRKMKQRFYVAPDGTKYPLKEALHDFPIRVYKADRNKAKQGDPGLCLIALGARRHRHVVDVFVGSGKDAYVIIKGPEGEYAMHFTIPAATRRIVDGFDKARSAVSAIVIFKMPTAGRTHEARKTMNSKRRAELKAGTGKPKKSRLAGIPRITRLGVVHRPRANIVTEVTAR